MRGQTNYFDFMIGATIFIIAITAFFSYTNVSGQQQRQIDTVTLSDTLLSPGYPLDWNTTNVIRPGLLTNGSIDPVKWKRLAELVNESPDTADSMLAATYTYRISVTPSNLTPITNGPASVNFSKQNDVQRVRRIVAYNGTLAVLEVLGWR